MVRYAFSTREAEATQAVAAATQAVAAAKERLHAVPEERVYTVRALAAV